MALEQAGADRGFSQPVAPDSYKPPIGEHSRHTGNLTKKTLWRVIKWWGTQPRS